jgi:hypothetical protein
VVTVTRRKAKHGGGGQKVQPLAELPGSYDVSHSTISRLTSI